MGCDYLQGTNSCFGAGNWLHPQNLLPQPRLRGGCEHLQGHRDQGLQLEGGVFVVVFVESTFQLNMELWNCD